MRFKDQVVIITGGGSGIGLATACRLGAEGAQVVLADLSADNLAKAEPQVRQAGAPDVLCQVCDVGQEASVEACAAAALQRFGRWDGLVNNAGLMLFKPLEAQTEEDWLRILRVDLLGAFFFLKQAFLKMPPGGAVVNVSSIHALETTPRVAPYAAAKAALVSLTRSASMEGKAKGLRVNAILPGAIDTPMLWENPNIKAGIETLNANDVGKPQDVAATIAYLLSLDAAFVDGAAVLVDGGRLSKL